MSAAPQLPLVWASSRPQLARRERACDWEGHSGGEARGNPLRNQPGEKPCISLAFYRKHTESTLRRYLYASMQVGRAPSILGDPVCRGWASSRKVRTFEDALIFVLDVERCLKRLDPMQRLILSRIVLQEYTQAEVASMMQMAPRTIGYKFSQSLDCLTEKLLESGLLVIPD
jgi:hypothetical protein